MFKGRLLIDSNDIEEELDFEDSMSYLTELMGEKNDEIYWKVSVENAGWQGLSGHKYIEATTGSELLRGILPKTENHYRIYNSRKGFVIVNYHHDSPTGETYWVRQCCYETYQNLGGNR